MTSLLVFRTHRFNAKIANEINHLRSTGLPILIVADERAGPIETPGYAKASLTADSVRHLSLGVHPDMAWRCGDYALFLAAEAMPHFDTFWLIEGDVRVNFTRPADFFSAFDDLDADFLSVRHDLAPDDWFWTRRMAPFRTPVYRTLFCLLRISRRAIEHLLPARRDMRDLKYSEFPNDESFVATVLSNDGFVCRTFDERASFIPSRTFSFSRPVSGKLLDAAPRDNLVYHPVLYGEDYLNKALYLCRRYPREDHLRDMVEGVRVELGNERAAAFAAEAGAFLAAGTASEASSVPKP